MEIDYEYTQLSDDELREELSKRRRETIEVAERLRAARVRRAQFRFVGGML